MYASRFVFHSILFAHEWPLIIGTVCICYRTDKIDGNNQLTINDIVWYINMLPVPIVIKLDGIFSVDTAAALSIRFMHYERE